MSSSHFKMILCLQTPIVQFLLCARDEGFLLQGAKKTLQCKVLFCLPLPLDMIRWMQNTDFCPLFVLFDVGNCCALQRPTSMSVDGPYEYSIASEVWYRCFRKFFEISSPSMEIHSMPMMKMRYCGDHRGH